MAMAAEGPVLLGVVAIEELRMALQHGAWWSGPVPAAADLDLFLHPRKLAVIHKQTREEVAASSYKATGDQGRAGLVRTLAWLASEKHVVCTVEAAERVEEEGLWPDLRVLVRVELQPSFFRADPDSGGEVAMHVWRLMEHSLSPEHHLSPELRLRRWSGYQWQRGKARAAAVGATSRSGAAGGNEDGGDGGLLAPASGGVDGHDGRLRDSIFRMVLPSDWQLEEPEPPGLRCSLFRYQRRALAWMRWREGVGEPQEGSLKAIPPKTDFLWRSVTLPSGAEVFYNSIEGLVSTEPVPPPPEQVHQKCGILADEMGLGKTVLVIALALSNLPPWRAERAPAGGAAGEGPGSPVSGGGDQPGLKHEQPGVASSSSPPPLLARKLMERLQQSRASGGEDKVAVAEEGHGMRGGTLVLCPPALLQQWRNELSNHAGSSLLVEVYDGLQGLAAVEDDMLKPAEREAQLLARLANGRLGPSYNAGMEADSVAARLMAADVVLTSLDVLQRDVHYQPCERSLRVKKRYAIPESPLTRINWWRLVLDEAQMVGPISAAGVMVERINAAHRWCVTGTPIGAKDLLDVQALLAILQHNPFSADNAWSHIVSKPLVRGGRDAANAWQTLRATLQPLMWRNTKQVVSSEFQLPERSLVVASLQFQQPELQFYAAARDKMRSVRDQIAELSSPAAPHELVGATAAAVASAMKKRRRSLQSLEEMAYQESVQLRLACIHPQLTRHWKELGSELDLNAGGTVSMEEVMQRLVDKAIFGLQDAERSLCSHLNSLAITLLRASDAGEGPSSKKRRTSKGPRTRDETLQEALQLLEMSFRVAEKGIAAMDLSREETEKMPHPPAGPSATILAWKKLQINTATQLEVVYRELGNSVEADKMDKDAQEKMVYVREQAHTELASAQERLKQVEARMEEIQALLASCWDSATSQGFPATWGEGGDVVRGDSPQSWVDSVLEAYRAAQQEETAELEAEDNFHAMLGTVVQKRMGEIEKQLHVGFVSLERFVTQVRTERAIPGIQKALGKLSGSVTPHEELRALCTLMETRLKLIGEFRQKTILSRWYHVLVEPLPAQTVDPPPASSELLCIREAAATSAFVASPTFHGDVPGCVFKLGEQGVGYYRDTTPASQLKVEEVRQCADQVLRALGDHSKRLQKQAGAEVSALLAYRFSAVESKLETFRQQIALVRLLKELHTSQSNVRLRTALQEEVDLELKKAAEKPPVGGAGEEQLRKLLAHWKQEAVGLQHKARFLQSRMEGAQQGQQAAATAAAATAAAMEEVGEGGSAAGEHPTAAPVAGPSSPGAPEPAAMQAAPAAPEGVREEDAQGMECPVCLNAVDQEASLFLFTSCGHSYCTSCAKKVVASGFCAVCRTKVNKRQAIRVAVATTRQTDQQCDPDFEALGKIHVQGDWSIKVQALVRRVRHLAENAPEEKSLVFSQFPDALKLVSLALTTNGVQHVQLIGGKLAVRRAMREFLNNDSIKVFLLSHRVGAAGLTLVRASHVFLLEPALDPAIEQQAVARVHRIGQQRPVTVTRLIVGNSIEEQVLAIQESKQALFPEGGEGEVMTLDTAVPRGEGRLDAADFQGLMDAIL